MPGPLHGIRIIDLTAVVSGPFATLHLADMGADVIKVEPPEGDIMRNPGTPPTKGMGPIFLAANRNKKSVCLDLKRPEAVEVVKRLAADADVFVHNNRPQAIERLGLGYDAIDALMAGFPAGTLSGAPKVRAMEIIDELEKEKRGPYAGCVGYFSADGNMDTCIVLRTAIVKDGRMYVQAGAGVVADSDPAAEQMECVYKARALFRAADEAVRIAEAARRGNR